MNIASAELLQNAIEHLSDTLSRQKQLAVENAYRQSQLGLEQQRTAVDQAFRNAQLAHYGNLEQAASDRADAAQQTEADKFGLMKAAQQFSQAQAALPFALENLRDTTAQLAQSVVQGDTDPDDADQQFRNAIDQGIGKDNPALMTQLLSVPDFKNIYDGQADWGQLFAKIQQQTTAAPATPAASPTPGGAPQASANTTAPTNLVAAAPTAGGTSAFALPAGQGSAAVPTALPTPPASHIAYLRANPGAAADFDAKYGAGAATQYLKPTPPIPGGGGFPITLPLSQPTSQTVAPPPGSPAINR